MKRIGWIMTLLLIVCSFSMELSAQGSIDALVKKCEAMTTEDMYFTVMRTKDPKTKEVIREVLTITIKNNPNLVNEFLAAFQKEEVNAIQSSENRRAGQSSTLNYKFENEIHSSTYILSSREKDVYLINITKVPKGEKPPFTNSLSYTFPAVPVRSTAATVQSLREAVALLDSIRNKYTNDLNMEINNPVSSKDNNSK